MTPLIERGGLREPPFRFSDFATSVSSSSVEAFRPSDQLAGFNLLAVFQRFALPDVARWDRSLSDPNTMRFGELIAEDLDDGKSVKRLSVTANSECLMAIIPRIYVRHFQVFSR